MPSSSNVSQDVQGQTSTASSENPWTKKKKKPTSPNQSVESSKFEKGLLNLLASQTADIASDDLSFFSSLGPILKTFDLEQKFEFRSRVLNVVTSVKNMHYRPSSSTSMVNLTSPDVRSPPQYEQQNMYNTPSPYNYDNDHPSGSSENIEHV
ncbi:unnamed protein product [Parnassius apollo]|uniref:(apollo) hypothetical protein n=1 Tax=Parnassius apollo TaxID=110799 RepID=A0A8S3W212_PARAO|nr:unnamed protein product [Parnassius apollo]